MGNQNVKSKKRKNLDPKNSSPSKLDPTASVFSSPEKPQLQSPPQIPIPISAYKVLEFGAVYHLTKNQFTTYNLLSPYLNHPDFETLDQEFAQANENYLALSRDKIKKLKHRNRKAFNNKSRLNITHQLDKLAGHNNSSISYTQGQNKRQNEKSRIQQKKKPAESQFKKLKQQEIPNPHLENLSHISDISLSDQNKQRIRVEHSVFDVSRELPKYESSEEQPCKNNHPLQMSQNLSRLLEDESLALSRSRQISPLKQSGLSRKVSAKGDSDVKKKKAQQSPKEQVDLEDASVNLSDFQKMSSDGENSRQKSAIYPKQKFEPLGQIIESIREDFSEMKSSSELYSSRSRIAKLQQDQDLGNSKKSKEEETVQAPRNFLKKKKDPQKAIIKQIKTKEQQQRPKKAKAESKSNEIPVKQNSHQQKKVPQVPKVKNQIDPTENNKNPPSSDQQPSQVVQQAETIISKSGAIDQKSADQLQQLEEEIEELMAQFESLSINTKLDSIISEIASFKLEPPPTLKPRPKLFDRGVVVDLRVGEPWANVYQKAAPFDLAQ